MHISKIIKKIEQAKTMEELAKTVNEILLTDKEKKPKEFHSRMEEKVEKILALEEIDEPYLGTYSEEEDDKSVVSLRNRRINAFKEPHESKSQIMEWEDNFEVNEGELRPKEEFDWPVEEYIDHRDRYENIEPSPGLAELQDNAWGVTSSADDLPWQELGLPNLANVAAVRRRRKTYRAPRAPADTKRNVPYEYVPKRQDQRSTEDDILDLDCVRDPAAEIDGWIRKMGLIINTNHELKNASPEVIVNYLSYKTRGNVRNWWQGSGYGYILAIAESCGASRPQPPNPPEGQDSNNPRPNPFNDRPEPSGVEN